ncbi:MAG: thioesterase family protein [Candidatus Acidiferrum sp.]
MMFERRVVAGWSDMDFNSHMRNTAYLDKSADVRMMYFSENGFSMQEFMRLRLGP